MNTFPIDTATTLTINKMGTPALDPIVLFLTDATTWIPLYIILFAVMYLHLGWKRCLIAAIGIVIAIALADQMASGICKPLFQRPRPTNEPSLEGLVRIVNNYRGGPYGFFSSHAANTCALATFLTLTLRQRLTSFVLLLYCVINCWTRLYLGVHYVSDILVGLAWGALIGWIIYILYVKACNKLALITQ